MSHEHARTRSSRRRWLAVAVCLQTVFSGLGLAAAQQPHERDVLEFGIVPQQAARDLARSWVPVLQYLSEHSGCTLRFRTAPDIPTFEQRCAEGEYDFAYMNPYHYTVYHEAPGYEAFAKARDKEIRGIVVVRKGSAIQGLQDLSGKTLAFPSPGAFAASMLPRARLQREAIPFTPSYVLSHDSVYQAVAKGLSPAGGGVLRTLQAMDREVSDQLRVLWTTEGYTPHAFAVHPRVSSQAVRRITAAMRSMHESPEGRKALENIKLAALEPAQDSDWDDVRAAGLSGLGTPSSRPHLTLGLGPGPGGPSSGDAWVQVIASLEQQTGYEIELVRAQDEVSFEQHLENAHYDIAYLDPKLTLLQGTHSYEIFAKPRNGGNRSVVVVRRDGPLGKLTHLTGGTLGVPTHGAFALESLALKALDERSVLVSVRSLPTADSVYKGVLQGSLWAGASSGTSLARLEPEARKLLDVIWVSGPHPSRALVAHPRVDREKLAQLMRSLETLHADKKGSDLLRALGIQNLEVVDDTETAKAGAAEGSPTGTLPQRTGL